MSNKMTATCFSRARFINFSSKMAVSVLYIVLIILSFASATERLNACTSSPVYCYGPLLDTVQRMNIFQSKTFVDMPMKYDPAVVMQNFKEFRKKGNVTKELLKKFVLENFDPVGHELDQWTPTDWVPNPKLLNLIKEPEYKEFAKGLNGLWKVLGRKMNPDIAQHPKRHSLLYVPHPFIVPGDRFQEFFYWDTYWIIKGLILSDMVTTAKLMIENLLHLVKIHGLVPNGGRIYFIRRSQPPLLTPMVDLYHSLTRDDQFIKDNFEMLEKEYRFWTVNRTKVIEANGRKYKLSHYNVKMGYPRPEGYSEDLKIAEHLPVSEATRVYSDIASACESGWDFSSRWFKWHGPDRLKLSSIKTRDIIPVDLNTFLCWNEFLLAKFAQIIGDTTKVQAYEKRAKIRWAAMMDLMWDEKDGVWYDYDLSANATMKKRRNFYPSNVFPLLLQSKGHFEANMTTVNKVVDYLKNSGVLDYPGGIPTSKLNTTQQWDFPNAWSPLVSLVIDSLASSESPRAKKYALEIASKWVESNYLAWKKYGHMYEKYTVKKRGEPGGGGEYEVQVGFGWSNGVILELLSRYGDELSLSPEVNAMSSAVETNDKSDWKLYLPIPFITLIVLGVFCFVLRKIVRQRRFASYRVDYSRDRQFLITEDDYDIR